MKLEQAAAIIDALPGVTVGAKWGNKTWAFGDKGLAWVRPFSKADLKRFGDETPPQGDILAVKVENLDAKDALLAMELPGFFTIPHFNGYAAVLVELRKARVRDVRAAIMAAYRAASSYDSKPHAAVARSSRRPPRRNR